jgi:hypothetical protein
MTSSNGAGWYDDPNDSSAQRYWDGQEWTPHRQRKQSSGSVQPPVAPYVAPASYQQPQVAPTNYLPPPTGNYPPPAPSGNYLPPAPSGNYLPPAPTGQDVSLGAQGQPMPNTHLVWSVFSIFFCFPLGILAIINATKVSNLWALGQHGAAQAAADSARKFAFWATIAWVVWAGAALLFGVVLPILFGLSMFGAATTSVPSSP